MSAPQNMATPIPANNISSGPHALSLNATQSLSAHSTQPRHFVCEVRAIAPACTLQCIAACHVLLLLHEWIHAMQCDSESAHRAGGSSHPTAAAAVVRRAFRRALRRVLRRVLRRAKQSQPTSASSSASASANPKPEPSPHRSPSSAGCGTASANWSVVESQAASAVAASASAAW